MRNAHWIALIAWWVYVAEPAAVVDRQTGRTYPTFQWVPKERYLHKEFCESRATEYRRQGQQAVCYFLNE
jgi:hypothetical protein